MPLPPGSKCKISTIFYLLAQNSESIVLYVCLQVLLLVLLQLVYLKIS